MPDNTLVKFNDLLDAFIWVSGSDSSFEHEAYVSRLTGKTHYTGLADFGIEEEQPEDLGNEDLYIAVPHKNDLELGRDLVFRFVEDHLPDSADQVHDFFRSRGAYARFKNLLERKGQLDHWHDYENAATEQALREWCEDNGLVVAETQKKHR
jgi:hypothetical protein